MRLFLTHLNPGDLFTNSEVTPDQRSVHGALVPGAIYLALWGASALVALRHGRRDAIALHAVVGAALVFAAVSMSRIVGATYFYLMLWSWGITALVGFATCTRSGWSCASGSTTPSGRAPRAAGSALLAAAIVVQVVFFSVDAANTDVRTRRRRRPSARLPGPPWPATRRGRCPAGGAAAPTSSRGTTR